jgi:hypothetical protein
MSLDIRVKSKPSYFFYRFYMKNKAALRFATIAETDRAPARSGTCRAAQRPMRIVRHSRAKLTRPRKTGWSFGSSCLGFG